MNAEEIDYSMFPFMSSRYECPDDNWQVVSHLYQQPIRAQTKFEIFLMKFLFNRFEPLHSDLNTYNFKKSKKSNISDFDMLLLYHSIGL